MYIETDKIECLSVHPVLKQVSSSLFWYDYAYVLGYGIVQSMVVNFIGTLEIKTCFLWEHILLFRLPVISLRHNVIKARDDKAKDVIGDIICSL